MITLRSRPPRCRAVPGQAIVEFVLCSFVFFGSVMGVMEGSRLVYSVATLAHAVNERASLAARPPETNPPGSSVSAVQDRVRASAYLVDIGSVNVSVAGGKAFGARDYGDRVRVEADTTFVPVVGWIFGGTMSIPFSFESEIAVE